jgi:hypothetical protein
VACAVFSSLQNPATSPESPPDQIVRKFQFLVTRQMKWKPFEAVAISPESGAATTFRGQRKMLSPNGFRNRRTIWLAFVRPWQYTPGFYLFVVGIQPFYA